MSRPDRAAALLLVHGAGSGPWIFDDWPSSFPAVPVAAVDLQEGLDVAMASMTDYAGSVVKAAAALRQPVALCGWSMGGLVVLLAASRCRPHSVILIEPSPPAEVQGFNADIALDTGTFNPEEVYGPFPRGIRSRRESSLARAERKRGIRVPELPCPSLVICGVEFPTDRGAPVAALYGSTLVEIPGVDHWALLRNVRTREAIARFIGSA